MKIKFLEHSKLVRDEILIGKNGCIRFKKETVNTFGIKPGQTMLIGYDADETPIRHIYLIFNKDEGSTNGWRVMFQNKSYFISARTLVNNFSINLPVKCKYERYSDETHNGIRLILPKPITQN